MASLTLRSLHHSFLNSLMKLFHITATPAKKWVASLKSDPMLPSHAGQYAPQPLSDTIQGPLRGHSSHNKVQTRNVEAPGGEPPAITSDAPIQQPLRDYSDDEIQETASAHPKVTNITTEPLPESAAEVAVAKNAKAVPTSIVEDATIEAVEEFVVEITDTTSVSEPGPQGSQRVRVFLFSLLSTPTASPLLSTPTASQIGRKSKYYDDQWLLQRELAKNGQKELARECAENDRLME